MISCQTGLDHISLSYPESKHVPQYVLSKLVAKSCLIFHHLWEDERSISV